MTPVRQIHRQPAYFHTVEDYPKSTRLARPGEISESLMARVRNGPVRDHPKSLNDAMVSFCRPDSA